MIDSSRQIRKIVMLVSGAVFAVAALFFGQFVVRLVYRNLAGTAPLPSNWGYFWAVAFPGATIFFGVLSWLCFRKMKREGSKAK